MKETIHRSKATGKLFLVGTDGRTNIDKPVTRDLTGYTHTNAANVHSFYEIWERELPEGENSGDTHTQDKPPLLLGQKAKDFYVKVQMPQPISRARFLKLPENKQRGYFRTSFKEGWVTFDNTGTLWREETHEEERLCIEWFKK